MNKTLLIVVAMFFATTISAQVGVGTQTPKATLEIVGDPTNLNKIDGVLIPRISREKAITMIGDLVSTEVENSTLVYVDDITGYSQNDTSVASQINSPGYYYFKKSTSKWAKLTDYDDVTGIVSNNSYWAPQATNVNPKVSTNTENIASNTTANDKVLIDIYQKGKVGIGYATGSDISNNFDVNKSPKQLDVLGDFRSIYPYVDPLNPNETIYYGIESNSIALPVVVGKRGNVMYSAKSKSLGDYSYFNKKYDGNIFIQSNDEVYFLSRKDSITDTTTAKATQLMQNAYSIGGLLAEFGKTKEDVFAFQLLKDKFIVENRSNPLGSFGIDFTENKNKFFIGNYYSTTSNTSYTFPNQRGTTGQTLKLKNNQGELEWADTSISSASPKFFYMPSIVLPINGTSTQYVTYNASNQTYTVDLYAAFKAQFDTPIKSSNSTTNSLADLVLSRDKYEYHIVYADNTIFPHNDIIFSTTAGEEGKFTYKVDASVIVRNTAFMNIVIKVK